MNLSEQSNFKIVDAHVTKPKGGSLRVVLQKKNSVRHISESVESILSLEQQGYWHQPQTYHKLLDLIYEQRCLLIEKLEEWKKERKKIIGFGASHSTTTLLYHFGIARFIEFIVDDNPVKHNTYSPGVHIPVFSTEKMYVKNPEIVLILSWQHQENIINRHKKFLRKGQIFVVPLPTLKMIPI